MSYIKLNGIEFDADVAISTYNRSFNVLDGDNAGRVLSGRMIRDVIGTYLGHMRLIQGKNPQQLRQTAENMAKQRGTSIEEIARQLGIPMK